MNLLKYRIPLFQAPDTPNPPAPEPVLAAVEPVIEPVVPPEPVIETPPAPKAPQMVPVSVVAGLRAKNREIEDRAARAERERDEARSLAERLSAPKQPDGTPAPQTQQRTPAPQGDADVERRAEYLVFTRDVSSMRDKGIKEFGPAFLDTIKALGAVGADDDNFVSQVMAVDTDKAHVLLNDLAQDLEKTASLVTMDPTRRIAELTRMAIAAQAAPKVETPVTPTEPAKPAKVVSKAPAPAPVVTPSASKEIDGYSDEASDDQFTAQFTARM